LSTKEFVVNFATSATRIQMNNSSRNFKPDEDEFILSKLKKKKSKLVKAPSVKDSPVNLECKLVKIIKLKSNSKKTSTMIIGEVIGIFIKDKFIKNNRVDSVSMRYIARMGYSEYTTVASKFNLNRK
jgi:Conserved protein/domain typically associated with flavoprotein oxygenases, DIM6/NTAB family